jgi:CheY-like chemotaxis protein
MAQANILVIEDAQITRRAISKVLQREGYTVIEASRGDEGLSLALEQCPACIVLDLLLPGLTGWEVMAALRDRQLNIPVIVVTADIQHSSRERCLALGAIAVIPKFPKPEAVVQAVQQALSGGTP